MRRVERSRAPLVVEYVSVYAIRIKTLQVYTNAKSEELAKKLEASGNTAKQRMYSGGQKSPAGSPTSSTASGLDLCLRMCLRPRMQTSRIAVPLTMLLVSDVVKKKRIREELYFRFCAAVSL